MSSIDTVVRAARKIESLLEQRLGATGTGLHAKLTSVENSVPEHIRRKIRYIATLRNKIVHNDGVELDNPKAFQSAYDEVVEHFEAFHIPRPSAGEACVGTKLSGTSTLIELASLLLWPLAMLALKAAVIVVGTFLIIGLVIPAIFGLLFY